MLRTYFQETFYDMAVDVAQKYAEGIRLAIMAGRDFDAEKKKSFMVSKQRGFEDKLYIGNIHRIENHLYWNDEELADDDEIVNVIVIDGPVTRDGDGCSYGSKDHRDQILYANTIPQVVGHLFILNTPGGAASSRIDYEQAIADCREKGKTTVAWVDGMCCSAGQFVSALCDRTVVMNGRHTIGCIGTMCAFWGVANNTVDQDGYRYIELVSVTTPDKNAEYREAVDGKTEKMQAELNKLGEEFRESVRRNRPLVKEERLTGKTFDAEEVMGELVDEIGDYNRAIECVFELAGKTLTPARLAIAEPEEKPEEDEPDEQKDMARLNEQQKQAIAANAGATVMVGDGHVKMSVDGMFGPESKEIANPKNNNDMTEQEKMAQEAAAAPAVQEQQGAAAQEQQPAQEEQPAGEARNDEGEQPGNNGGDESTASDEAIANAEAEIDRITATLHNAEVMIAQKDKTIGEMKATIDTKTEAFTTLNKSFEEQSKLLADANALLIEKDKTIGDHIATIEALKKQVGDLKAEVKELSEKPAPMVSAESGIPADNGTGDAPKQKERITRNMTYEEIRAMVKKG